MNPTQKELSQTIGIVNTQTIPDNLLSVLDIIKLVGTPHQLVSKLSIKDQKIIGKAIEKTGLEHLLHKPFHQISDGEKQKIMIARVLLKTPL